MARNALAFTRVLLNRFHGGNFAALLTTLPSEEAEKIQALEIHSKDTATAFEPPLQFLDRIHYSWYIEPMHSFPQELQALLLSVLPKDKVKFLQSHLHVAPQSTPPTKQAKTHLLYQLARALYDPDVLPFSFLEDTPVKILAGAPKPVIVEVMHLLGLYDLAGDLRHMIDKENLKRIYSCVPASRQPFLRKCMKLHEKFSMPRIGLDNWRGTEKELTRLLHRRGLTRLCKALAGQPHDLIWHLSRRLDTGRGNILLKEVEKKEIPNISPYLLLQVIDTLNSLTTKSAS